MKKGIRYIVESAVIGAFYAALTLVFAPISFGPIQFRVSEALTVLPLFTPAAIPGLFVGCVISNAAGMLMGTNIAGVLDILLGSAATLAAAFLTYLMRKITIKSLPILSFLPPIIFNAVTVGAELSFFIPEQISFVYSAATVGLGEAVVVLALGIPLFYILRRTRLFDGGRIISG